MWELYTSQQLFPGMTVAQVFYSVVYEQSRPEVPQDCPTDFRGLMEACWHADERCRFAAHHDGRLVQAVLHDVAGTVAGRHATAALAK